MNILFYTPLNTRCRDIESQAIAFRKKGHSIFLLTQSPHALLQDNFSGYGFKTESTASSSRFAYLALIQRLLKFTWYCWRNRIDVVYAHLEPANFVAVLGQFMVKARIIICRHHMDYARLNGFDNDLSYRATYRLANDVVVVSRQAKQHMVTEEGIKEDKIHFIPLSYDFALYGSAEPETVHAIRKKYAADILLLTICRLTWLKRPEVSVQLVKKLRDAGHDAKLLILGKGELQEELETQVRLLGLTEAVFFTGYVDNVLDYMAASDFLVHPSVSESSCISVKEAGLVDLPVIVCRDVGDFNDVIEHNKNGFVVEKHDFVDSSLRLIQQYVANKEALARIGANLHAAVYDKFDIKNALPYYEKMFHQKTK
jgi:glycosyltransferase involved in cell wall biosynthesis